MRIGELNTIEEDPVYVHPAGDDTELTLLEILAGGSPIMMSPINLDLSELTVAATLRLYYRVDNVNYRRRFGAGAIGGEISWSPGNGEWVQWQLNGTFDHDIKVTIQSASGGEPAPVAIPVSYNGAR